MRFLLSFLLLLSPAVSFAQTAPSLLDTWSDFRIFAGAWTGEEKTSAGVAEGSRNYRFFLDGHFIEDRRTAIYAPQPENPDGETRQYLSLYHYNTADDVYHMRQYYSRGFVVDFQLTGFDPQERRFTWVSSRVQNTSATLIVRYVVDFEDDDNFTETYELQRSGEEFREVGRNHWTRKP